MFLVLDTEEIEEAIKFWMKAHGVEGVTCVDVLVDEDNDAPVGEHEPIRAKIFMPEEFKLDNTKPKTSSQSTKAKTK